MHAFIDESKRDGYMLCAVTVATGDVAALRKQVDALRPRGSTRIHMKSVSKKEAPKLVTEVAKLDASSRLYLVKSGKMSERSARDLTLGAAVRDLTTLSVSRVLIESCNQDREDNRTIRDAIGVDAPFVYDHASPSDPLLWLPDIHAWAWGRGGQMRAKIAHRIEVFML
ncbi:MULTISPECIES: hypothetical protein [Nocardiaceae]|uniref:DUF3800 domain-containing protein n=1 Tax=Rhodococcus rhodochrous TaxID=1829 RepID=A0AA47AAJ9_RHORH|nr:hypothetical protein [Rhodococcus rhodochrous]UZF48489.1 hypothetical protein KUM34_029395 [Rhodococcus rhodochrous]